MRSSVPDPVTVLGALSGLGWAAFAVRGLAGLRDAPPLPPLEPATAPVERVRVVLAARDEEAALRRTLDGLRAQRGVALEIVAVDDRSIDDTPALLATAAAADDRIRTLRVDAVPAGWLGKCHACWAGARAEGPRPDWLLFLDADSWLGPDTIARAVQTARRTEADHLCLLPQLAGQSFVGRTVTLAMSFGLFQQALGLERNRRSAYVGVGAFQLFRAEAYDALGGHEAVRLEVVEDIALARRARRHGLRSRLRFAADALEVRWITDLPSVFTVLAKNYFALLGYRTLLAALLVGGGLSAFALACATPAGLAGLGVFAAASLPIARRYRWSPLHALLAPAAIPCVLATMAWSACRTLWAGGVTWRGSFHPLAELRGFDRATTR
jgi:glycosyltransferase involved in cell wall biosynthesis